MRRLALVASATLALLVLSAPASAADACWQRLVRDWSADASVDGRYPVACYREAIAKLPVDLLTYSSAPTDLEAALQARILEAQPPPAAAARADSTKDSSWTGRGLTLPLVVVVLGVIGLVGALAGAGFVLRRRARMTHALDTRPRA